MSSTVSSDRKLSAGDLVNIGGSHLAWQVKSVDGDYATLRSTRSGQRRYRVHLGPLFWHDTGARVWDPPPSAVHESDLLEALGVRLRRVDDLGTRALWLPDQGLLLVDTAERQTDALAWAWNRVSESTSP